MSRDIAFAYAVSACRAALAVCILKCHLSEREDFVIGFTS